jgi:K+-transporting ATPase KdpF subunit
MREAVITMENIIVGAVSAVLIIYLFVSLIRPELF